MCWRGLKEPLDYDAGLTPWRERGRRKEGRLDRNSLRLLFSPTKFKQS